LYVEIIENKYVTDFWSSDGAELALGRGKTKLPEKELSFGRPKVGGCDRLTDHWKPKWKFRLKRAFLEERQWHARRKSNSHADSMVQMITWQILKYADLKSGPDTQIPVSISVAGGGDAEM
jgi:hypothetical protein